MRQADEYSESELFLINSNSRTKIINLRGVDVLEINHRPIKTKRGLLYSVKELDKLSYCLHIEDEHKMLDDLKNAGDPLPERYFWDDAFIIRNPLSHVISNRFRTYHERTLKEEILKQCKGDGTNISTVVKRMVDIALGTSKSKNAAVELNACKYIIEYFHRKDLEESKAKPVSVTVNNNFLEIISNKRKAKQITKSNPKQIEDKDIIECNIQ